MLSQLNFCDAGRAVGIHCTFCEPSLLQSQLPQQAARVRPVFTAFCACVLYFIWHKSTRRGSIKQAASTGAFASVAQLAAAEALGRCAPLCVHPGWFNSALKLELQRCSAAAHTPPLVLRARLQACGWTVGLGCSLLPCCHKPRPHPFTNVPHFLATAISLAHHAGQAAAHLSGGAPQR